jgi:thymidylate synthase
MIVIEGANVQEVLPRALELIRKKGVPRDTRYGPVLVMEQPVTTVYRRPTERVIFYPGRDANPYFHLMEALWMLAGRNDVAWPAQFAKKIAEFSDDGETFHGAYGHRWRQHFGGDQLEAIVQNLRNNPDCRRQMLQMWDGVADLGHNGKDVPCNTVAHFQVNPWGTLDMTVFCRSNDIIWGCYGANAVHFSILQEYMAARIGVPVGSYWQISDNWHAYVEVLERTQIEPMANYYDDEVSPYPLIHPKYANTWDAQLEMFMEQGPVLPMGPIDPFFRSVACPILASWDAYKSNEGMDKFNQALAPLENCKARDWQVACAQWLTRRLQKWLRR